jgi:hypothetical protein
MYKNYKKKWSSKDVMDPTLISRPIEAAWSK